MDKNHIQKIIVEGQYVDSIGITDGDMGEPCFKSISELRYGIKTNNHLAFPVLDKNEKIIMAIQLEAQRNKKTNKTMGFSMIDDHVIKTFCHNIRMKVERMIAMREAQIRERNVVETLQLTSDICTQRSHKGLIIKIKDKLPKFMGFEAAGALIYDKDADTLFSLTENNKEDKDNLEEDIAVINFPTTLGITGMVFQAKAE